MSEIDVKLQARDRAYKEYEHLLIKKENIIEKYVFYENQLLVESDCGADEEKYFFLLELCELLESNIVRNTLKEHGYYQNDNDDWHRWCRE